MNELPRINSGEVQIIITKETESDEEFHYRYMTGLGLLIPIAVYSFFIAQKKPIFLELAQRAIEAILIGVSLAKSNYSSC